MTITITSKEYFVSSNHDNLWRTFRSTGRLMPTLQDLHQAIRMRDTNKVRALVACGSIKINSSLRSCTALSLAVYQGDENIVEFLLEKGAEVDKLSRDWNHRIETPLFTACRLGHIEVAKVLIQNGANVNITDFYNHSPLWIATRERSLGMVKLLIQNGADLNIADKWSQCPLYMACKYYGRGAIAEQLIQHGCRLDLADLEGRGAFYWSIVNGMEDLVKLLVRTGVYISTRERDLILGRNPVEFAQNNSELCQWLKTSLKHPSSLGQLCVQNIRAQLNLANGGTSIWKTIPQLPIPKSLQSALRLNTQSPFYIEESKPNE